MTTTTATTCPRCNNGIAAGTMVAETADGTVHIHCADAGERHAATDMRPARETESPKRADWKHWQRRSGWELNYDC